MKRPYNVMVVQDNSMSKMYHTEDESMHKAINAIEQIHALQYAGEFRVVYIEEIIQ